MSKSKISIITPCNRIIPWFNYRLINVCSQSFKDWEWIVLDNSLDGCVKKYIDQFFVSMQGIYYPDCVDKIKCFHETFEDIDIWHGKLGALRNRCIELTTCGDDGYILVLDSDDFIFDGFLQTIYDISTVHPDCEAITGMCVHSLGQYIEDGIFVHHEAMHDWVKKTDEFEIDILKKHNFNGVGFDEYVDTWINGNKQMYYIKPIESKLSFEHIDFCLPFDNATVLDDDGFPFITGFGHPIVYKKKAFLDKIGSYDANCYVEDNVCKMIPSLMNNIVYVNHPVYVQCMMLNKDLFRDSVSRGGYDCFDQDVLEKNLIEHLYKVYDALGDCRKTIKPIIWG